MLAMTITGKHDVETACVLGANMHVAWLHDVRLCCGIDSAGSYPAMKATFARWCLVAGGILLAVWLTIDTHSQPAHSTEFFEDDHTGKSLLVGLRDRLPESERTDEKPAALDDGIDERGLLSLFDSKDFKRARNKGRAILCALEKPDGVKGTGYNSFSDLAAWGWTPKTQDAKTIDSTLSNYAKELKAVGLSAVSPDVQGVEWTHSQETTHGGVKYLVGILSKRVKTMKLM